MLTQRQLEIFSYFLQDKQFVGLEELLDLTNMSERTIRYDISTLRKVLKEYNIEIPYSSDKGFYIPINHIVMAEAALIKLSAKNQEENTVLFQDEMFSQLLLLLATNEAMTSEQLCNNLYVSERTLANYLSEFNNYFNDNIRIKSVRNHGYSLEGSELELCIEVAKRIRVSIRKAYFPEDMYEKLDDILKDILSVDELTAIVNNYKKYNSMFKQWLNSKTFVNVLSFLIITSIRTKKNLCLLENKKHSEVGKLNTETINYIEGIIQYNHLDKTPIIECRVLVLAKYLNSQNIFINEKIDPDHEIIIVLDEIIEYLQKEKISSDFVFNYKNLKYDLSLHFQNFLSRNYVETTKEEKLILNEISYKYPEYHEVASDCAKVFNKHFKTELSEQEIAYITIYLFKNVIKGEGKKRVAVVCATGRGLSTLLATRIGYVFPNIEVVETMSYYQLETIAKQDNIDFVISTIPIYNSVYPVVRISNVFSNNDIRTIHNFLNEVSDVASLELSNLPNYFTDVDLSESEDSRSNLENYSTIISEIILSLIGVTNTISKTYPMTEDSILGLTIHLVMAIPRWLDSSNNPSISLETQYYEMEVKHPELVETMNGFFKNIEESLYISISNYERYAFYQYILRREENEKNIN